MTSSVRLALRETLLGLGQQISDNSFATPWKLNAQETSPEHLRWMIAHCLLHLDEWPVDKTSRWIGFIQGVLAVVSPTFSVSEERERTRPLFHAAYAQDGVDILKLI